SREQVRGELEPAIAQSVSPTRVEENKGAPPPARLGRSPAKIEGWGAARYALGLSSGAIPLEHGPGVELGLGLHAKILLRGRFTFDHVFPTTMHAGPVDVRTRIERWRVNLDFGLPIDGRTTALVLALGAGQDAIRLEPGSSSDPGIIPAGTSRSAPTALHAEARIET